MKHPRYTKDTTMNAMDYKKESLRRHRELRGKIEIHIKDPLETQESISIFYTPGMGAVCEEIVAHPESAWDLTGLNNSVAIISDGTAVLGLGDIGPHGALPVMEGKSMLFKRFGGINCYPIVLNTKDPDEIIATIKNIAPSYGAINLEDIAAPGCFYIEERLKEELDIPVFHDDQHGTAVVVLAALINTMKITSRTLSDCKIVVVGAGAAGTAIIKLLNLYAQPEILAVDSKGIVSKDRADLNVEKKKLLNFTNPNNLSGSLEDSLRGSDIFIGVSKAGLLTQSMVKSMNKNPIIFAMANPVPEIMPDEARKAGVAVMATGRSDFPNQINNALAFPGIFRGALDNRVKAITDQHKIAAAEIIASLVEDPSADTIVPSILDPRLVPAIAKVIV